MRIDETKSAEDNVWALINEANGTSLTAASGFTLGVSGAHAGPEPRNTKVSITAEESTGYQGTMDVFYNRRGFLDNVYPEPTEYAVPTRETTQAEIFTALVAMLKLVATDVLIVESVVADMTTITLRPIANSRLYTGDTPFTLSWPNGMMTVDQLLSNDDLPGFVMPLFDVPSLVTDTDLPGFEKVAKSVWMWKVNTDAKHAGTGSSTLTYLNGKIWYANYEKLRAYSPIDGEVEFELDLRAHFGTPVGTNLYYEIRAVDANNVLWLYGNAPVGQAQILRFDTNLMAVKDQFALPDPTDGSDYYTRMTASDGTTDFVWAIHNVRPSGGSFTYKLTRFDVATGAATDFTLPPAAGSIYYDHVSKRVWVSHGFSGNRAVNVYELDGTNSPVLLTTFPLYDTATGEFACAYDTPQGREMAIFDQNTATNYRMYLRRFNAVTGASIADMEITNPDASPHAGWMGPNGLLKYNATTDELYCSIYTPDGTDIWAFKRTDVTQARMVAAMNGEDQPWDYTLDAAGGKTFVLYEDDNVTMNYLAQLRQP